MKILNLPQTSKSDIFSCQAISNPVYTIVEKTINKGQTTIKSSLKPVALLSPNPSKYQAGAAQCKPLKAQSTAVEQLERLTNEDDDSMDSLTSEEVVDPLTGSSASSSSTLVRIDYGKTKQEQCTNQLDQLLKTIKVSPLPKIKVEPSPVPELKILNFTKPMPTMQVKIQPKSPSNIIRIDYGKAQAGPSMAARTLVGTTKPRITKQPRKAAAPVIKEAMVPIHEGSDILVPRNLLMKAFSKKPAQYTLRLAQILFGNDELERAAREHDLDDVFCTLEQRKLTALTSEYLQYICEITQVLKLVMIFEENVHFVR
jgi:hypothetical protein